MKSSIIKIISSIFHTWDPIGYTPSDEYDDLAIMIYKHLRDGKSKDQLMEFTREYLIKTVGLSSVDKSKMSEYIMQIINAYKIITEHKI